MRIKTNGWGIDLNYQYALSKWHDDETVTALQRDGRGERITWSQITAKYASNTKRANWCLALPIPIEKLMRAKLPEMVAESLRRDA